MSILMTTCDIATITKPWAIQRKVFKIDTLEIIMLKSNLYHFCHFCTDWFRAETIIRTNRLVGYQSTSRRQYYEIG